MLKDLQRIMLRNVSALAVHDGIHPTPVPGVRCSKVSHPDRTTKRRWHACLGFVIQGAKDLTVGRTAHHLVAGSYTATPMDLPALSRFVSASPENPFLAVLIEWNPRLLEEIAKPLETAVAPPLPERGHAVFIGASDERMQEAMARLTNLFARPQEAAILGPLVIRELLYHLMIGPAGPAIHQFARAGSKANRMERAIHTIKSDLAEEMDVVALARSTGLSRAGFFQAFKEMTAVSPIQYQKRLRLLEAQRLMVETEATAESAAFQVGYKSASQFNREYSRMFVTSPRRHAEKLLKERRVPVS